MQDGSWSLVAWCMVMLAHLALVQGTTDFTMRQLAERMAAGAQFVLLQAACRQGRA